MPVISRHYNSLLYEDDSDVSNESVAAMTREDNKACGTEQIGAEHRSHAGLRLAPLLSLSLDL